MVGLVAVVMEAVLGLVAAFGGAACIFARCVGTAAGNLWHWYDLFTMSIYNVITISCALYLFPRISKKTQGGNLVMFHQNTLRTNSNFRARNAEQLTSV